MSRPGARKYGGYVASERDEEAGGDRLMTVLGFHRWTLSQPRSTCQTSGWPDRFYVNAQRGLAVFWEAKREGGKQRAGQRVFQADMDACGIPYVCGPMTALAAWCADKKLITVHATGGYEVVR